MSKKINQYTGISAYFKSEITWDSNSNLYMAKVGPLDQHPYLRGYGLSRQTAIQDLEKALIQAKKTGKVPFSLQRFLEQINACGVFRRTAGLGSLKTVWNKLRTHSDTTWFYRRLWDCHGFNAAQTRNYKLLAATDATRVAEYKRVFPLPVVEEVMHKIWDGWQKQ